LLTLKEQKNWEIERLKVESRSYKKQRDSRPTSEWVEKWEKEMEEQREALDEQKEFLNKVQNEFSDYKNEVNKTLAGKEEEIQNQLTR